MPVPFSGAAAIDATIVPWKSASVIRSLSLRNRTGRVMNSGWVVSIPSSTIVIGKPAPGAVTRSAPICGIHHGAGSTGSAWPAKTPRRCRRPFSCAYRSASIASSRLRAAADSSRHEPHQLTELPGPVPAKDLRGPLTALDRDDQLTPLARERERLRRRRALDGRKEWGAEREVDRGGWSHGDEGARHSGRGQESANNHPWILRLASGR